MERLTIPGFKWTEDSIFRDIDRWSLAECLNRLSEYEDTGLTPDEINALRERDTAKAPEKLSGYRLKCPSCGLHIGRMEDNFCPECGQRPKLATEAQRPEWKDRMLHTFLGGYT